MLVIIFQDLTEFIFNTSEGSFVFVLILTLIVAILSALLTKRLINTEEVERKQRQIKVHEEEKQKIIELAEIDAAKYRKERKRWERKDALFKQTQQKLSIQRAKPMCIRFLPVLIIWIVAQQLIGTTPVAVSSMNAQYVPMLGPMVMHATQAPWITAGAWYMLCSMAFNSIFQRLFKVQTQTSGGGFGQMLSGQKAKALEFPDV
ncbi:MAG: EMC3/TMCO1 family protein [Promethearchaeota archaeon]